MELFVNILKWGGIFSILLPIVVILNNMYAKENKQLTIKIAVVVYIIIVTVFVLNEYYGFIERL